MSGLKINPGLVMMQHKSSMISQMMGGGRASSLPGMLGAGTATMQARMITRQFDTFERLSDLGYDSSGGQAAGREKTDQAEPSSAGGTALEPAEGDTPKAEAGASAQKSAGATYNTDKVDQEIQRLREQRKQFEKQLQSASDPHQAMMLQKQISRLDSELQQKDNDAYRREHAEISE